MSEWKPANRWMAISDSRSLAPATVVRHWSFVDPSDVDDEEWPRPTAELTVDRLTDDPEDGWWLSDGSWIRHHSLESGGFGAMPAASVASLASVPVPAGMMGAMDDTVTGSTCGYCGRPQRGSASAGDVALCHPDFASRSDDCYVLVTVDRRPLPDGRRWTGSGWTLVSPEFEARADELLQRDREILDRLGE